MQRPHNLLLLFMTLFFTFLPQGNTPLAQANEVLHVNTNHYAGHAFYYGKADHNKKAGTQEDKVLLAVTAISKDDAWAVGMIGGNSVYNCDPCAPLIEHWNGHQWKVVQDISTSWLQGGLFAISALNKNDVWAVGRGYPTPFIEHWNGQKWQVVSSPTLPSGEHGDLNSVVAISKNNAWAVGSDYPNPLVEHWNGQKWQIVTVPNSKTLGYFGKSDPIDDSLSAVNALGVNDVYIGGSTLLEHWDGQNWHILKRPVIGAARISVHSSKDIWVSNDVYGSLFNAMARWDGQQWQFYNLPYGTEQNHYTGGILEVKPNDVWSVGSSDFLFDWGNTEYTLIGHWNGQDWQRIKSPNPANSSSLLSGLAANNADDIWAVGETIQQVSQKQSGPFRPLIEHWDGISWQIVNGGTF